MAAPARMIRALDKDAVCIFIGPCIAKKSEAGQSQHIQGENADLVLTFEELYAMLVAKEILLTKMVMTLPIYGKRFCAKTVY